MLQQYGCKLLANLRLASWGSLQHASTLLPPRGLSAAAAPQPATEPEVEPATHGNWAALLLSTTLYPPPPGLCMVLCACPRLMLMPWAAAGGGSGQDTMIQKKGIKLRGAPLYLDMQATTPMDPRVVDAMLPFMTEHVRSPG